MQTNRLGRHVLANGEDVTNAVQAVAERSSMSAEAIFRAADGIAQATCLGTAAVLRLMLYGLSIRVLAVIARLTNEGYDAKTVERLVAQLWSERR